jgi:hypothetical protein
MIAGIFGAGFGYMLASAADRFTATHALDASGMDTPGVGNIYNSEAIDLPIWSSWQRVAAAAGSIVVPLWVAAYVTDTAWKSFFQIAGFAAVARTVGKAGDDTIGMLASKMSTPNATLQQLYAPEIAADAKLTSATVALPSAQPATFAGLPRFRGRPTPRMMGVNGPNNTAGYIAAGIDPTTAAVMGYLGQLNMAGGLSFAQLQSTAAAMVAQGYYAPNSNGGCNAGDSIASNGFCMTAGATTPASGAAATPGSVNISLSTAQAQAQLAGLVAWLTSVGNGANASTLAAQLAAQGYWAPNSDGSTPSDCASFAAATGTSCVNGSGDFGALWTLGPGPGPSPVVPPPVPYVAPPTPYVAPPVPYVAPPTPYVAPPIPYVAPPAMMPPAAGGCIPLQDCSGPGSGVPLQDCAGPGSGVALQDCNPTSCMPGGVYNPLMTGPSPSDWGSPITG